MLLKVENIVTVGMGKVHVSSSFEKKNAMSRILLIGGPIQRINYAKLLGIGTAKLIDIAIAKAKHNQEKMDSGKYKCIVNVF